ncbi:hypothetical protein TSUD_249620 [Trifolium subterraneum]|nr:hypothetical protein TSUD_249620 [Trifolium subterraneum]
MPKPDLEIKPSYVTEIVPKCCEIDNQIKLLSEAYHLVYGGPKNLLYDSTDLAEIRTPMNNTVLHIAALYGNDDIVTDIIDHAPKLLFTFNKNEDSVLHVAARGGHISTVKKLLATYADFERRDIANAWLEYTGYDYEVEEHDDGILCQKEYDGMSNMEDILYFVKKENNQGNTMFHEAMLCSDKKNIDGDNNIFKICEDYKTEDLFGNSLSKLCYEYYAIVIMNHAMKSVLYIAVENEDKDAVKQILEKCPTKSVRPWGLSPVVAAIMKGNKEMLSIILENKPTWIHSSDRYKRLPLHHAASIASYGGHVEVVKRLLEYCPNSTEMLDKNHEQNILHVASNYGKHEMVNYILQSQICEHHKMINQQDKNGDTPLHLAARSCHPTTVYYLVNHKRVNLDLVNKNNKTALDIVGSFYKRDKSSLRQASGFIPLHKFHLTWTALKSAGAKQSPTRLLYLEYEQSANSPYMTFRVEEPFQQSETKQSLLLPKKEKRNKEKSEPPPVDNVEKGTSTFLSGEPPTILFLARGSNSSSSSNSSSGLDTYKDRVQTLLLVSTLIITASVAACFSVPGDAEGKANNLFHAMFQLFIFFITISLFSAISSTIILFWATLGLTELVTDSLSIVMYLLGIALISLSLAFMAGLYTVISELTWLANVFLFMTVLFIVLVICLYMLLFLPSSSTTMPLRYISHYPFLFLASRAESQIDDDQEDTNY